MKEPLVSIIMPAFNAEKNIIEAINSVQNQTYKNWELIICEDNSTDKTKEILKNIDSSNIKVDFNDINRGVTYSRNKALSKAQGDFIAFLDADDYWMPNKLQLQVEFMLKNEYVFTCTSYGIIKDNKETNRVFNSRKKLSYIDYLKDTSIGNSTVIVNKKNMKNFYVEEGPLEDVATWMNLLKSDITCYGIKNKLAMYRVDKGSVSNNKVKNATRYFLLLRKREKLSLTKSLYYQANYMLNAITKRLF
ncbi:glycosyltransferase family 2 protein [Vagococcus fluvialis]|uniref:glycosyltransferase family 2 protein n=1 Tax=Vagococcus fluvialis TaxID=2738 RepID=UPI0037B08CC8